MQVPIGLNINRYYTYMDLLENIADSCPKNSALLGLDVGQKTIGVAVCNPDQTLATPIMTINRKKFSKDALIIKQCIEEYEVGGLIIGYPLNMDSTEGRRCQSIRDFTMELKRLLGAPHLWMAFWDERLSTACVEDFVDKSVNISRRKAKEKGVLDKLAAQVILQGALDYLAR